MAKQQREIERVEFSAGGDERIVGYMDLLSSAGNGWINLQPKATDDAPPPTMRFMSLFGGGSLGFLMCTWVRKNDPRRGRLTTLGISHLTARRARPRLAELDVAIPSEWRIEQDHPRRGLVLSLPDGLDNDVVLAWALRASEALWERPVATWRAEVHLPLS